MSGLIGVNLGGWLIPEKWMTPSLFEGVSGADTYTLLSSPGGRERYDRHIDTYITAADIAWMESKGIQLIRLPVPWWALKGSDAALPHEIKVKEKIDWLMDAAAAHGIVVLLDFHAAKGSQNGKDHSGRAGRVEWKDFYCENTHYVETLAQRYSQHPALWGIELLNEPILRGHTWTLLRFYRQTARSLKRILPVHIQIVYHDSFHPFVTAFFPLRATLDLHLYEIPARANESIDSYLERRNKRYRRLIRWMSRIRPVMVGEWSGVLPSEVRASLDREEKRSAIRRNINEQQVLYSESVAHAFWSYKANNLIMWSKRTTKR